MRFQDLDQEGGELAHECRFRFRVCLQRWNDELGEGHLNCCWDERMEVSEREL